MVVIACYSGVMLFLKQKKSKRHGFFALISTLPSGIDNEKRTVGKHGGVRSCGKKKYDGGDGSCAEQKVERGLTKSNRVSVCAPSLIHEAKCFKKVLRSPFNTLCFNCNHCTSYPFDRGIQPSVLDEHLSCGLDVSMVSIVSYKSPATITLWHVNRTRMNWTRKKAEGLGSQILRVDLHSVRPTFHGLTDKKIFKGMNLEKRRRGTDNQTLDT